jgi:hypothetical protein
MILTTTEGPLSALLPPLLLIFLVSRAMCTEPAAQPRVRVRALEYRGSDNTAGDPSVSVALVVELRKEPGSMLRSLDIAVGVRDADAPSCCQPAVLTGVTTVNSSSLWSADQEDQLRVVNFPLVMSSLNVSSLKTGDGGDEKRTLPLCVSVNGEGWTQAGWIFFPPFQEVVVSSNSDSKGVVSDRKHVVSDSKHLVSDSNHVATDSKHVASDSNHVVSDSKPVTSDSKHVASDTKHVASDSEHSDRESDGVSTSSSPEVSETETTKTGMA